MLTERRELSRGQMEIVDTEMLTPQNHLLRKFDEAIDFGKLYDMVGELYSEDNEQPSIDPVVLFKTVSYNFRHRFTAERWIKSSTGYLRR